MNEALCYGSCKINTKPSKQVVPDMFLIYFRIETKLFLRIYHKLIK